MSDLNALLLTLASRDIDAADRIRARGDLEDIYHPELEAIHIANAEQLSQIIDEHGLPGLSMVGVEGAEAVWLIIQHAISLPDFQRRCLPLLQEAARRGEFPHAYPVYLEDRISVNEGRPQRYGTQFDWDETGRLVPYPIEDLLKVNELRREVGLNSMEENVTNMRSSAGKPPADYEAKKRAYERWLTRVGWRA